jgi:hypothetical protein
MVLREAEVAGVKIGMRIMVVVFGVFALPVYGEKIPKDTEFRAMLMSPLSTATSMQGDTITAMVTGPEEFKNAILEGKVQQSKSGGKLKGTSILSFTFEKVNHNGEVISVQTNVKEIVNSKGVRNVDEEGRVVSKKNNIGKLGIGGGVGAVVGAVAGGAAGAAIGAGVGAAAAAVFVVVGTKGANVDFAPGSELILSLKERN